VLPGGPKRRKASRGKNKKPQLKSKEKMTPEILPPTGTNEGPGLVAHPGVESEGHEDANADPTGPLPGTTTCAPTAKPGSKVVVEEAWEAFSTSAPVNGPSEHGRGLDAPQAPETPLPPAASPLEELRSLADMTRKIHMAKTEAIQFSTQGTKQLAADVKYLLSLLERAKTDHEEQNGALAKLRKELAVCRRDLAQTKTARQQDKESFSRTVKAERATLEKRLRKSEGIAERRKIMIQDMMEWIESRHEQFSAMNHEMHEQLVHEKAQSATVLEQLVDELHADLEEVESLELPEERRPDSHLSPGKRGAEIETQTEPDLPDPDRIGAARLTGGRLFPDTRNGPVLEKQTGAMLPAPASNMVTRTEEESLHQGEAATGTEQLRGHQGAASGMSVFAKELMSTAIRRGF